MKKIASLTVVLTSILPSKGFTLDCVEIFNTTPPIHCEILNGQAKQLEDQLRLSLLKSKLDQSNIDRNWIFVLRYNLCSDEIAAIQNYSNLGYSTINRSLRSGEEDLAPSSIQRRICLIDKGLAKIDKYRLESYRGLGLSEREARNYLKVGSIVTDKAFSSTDTREHEVHQYMNKGDVRMIFRYTGNAGVHIQDLSLNPYEDEVLVPRGTRFRVESVTKMDDNRPYYLVELALVSKDGINVGQ